MPAPDQPGKRPEDASREEASAHTAREDEGGGGSPAHASTAPEHPVPAPGEPAGGMWPGVQAARADADAESEVEGVEDTALAPPGKPDGEADTRP